MVSRVQERGTHTNTPTNTHTPKKKKKEKKRKVAKRWPSVVLQTLQHHNSQRRWFLVDFSFIVQVRFIGFLWCWTRLEFLGYFDDMEQGGQSKRSKASG